MPKNGLIIAAVVVIAMLGIGGFFLLNQGSSPSSSNPQSNDSMVQSDNELANMFMDAFEGSGSIVCTYQDEESQGTAYIKNGMVMAETSGTDGAQYGNVILKDDTVWVWEANSNEGFMMENISEHQGDTSMFEQYSTDPDEIRREIEQNRPNCRQENVPESMFVPPSNVNFQTIEGMMEGMMEEEAMDGGQGGVPSQEEIDALMEQYGAQQ